MKNQRVFEAYFDVSVKGLGQDNFNILRSVRVDYIILVPFLSEANYVLKCSV